MKKFALISVLAKLVTLLLVACAQTPVPQEHNLLKIWNDQQVTINGLETDVLLANSDDVSNNKVTVYAIILAEKDDKKSLFVTPLEKYRQMDLSLFTIVSSNYLMVAIDQVPTMYIMTLETATAEDATPVFYK